MMDMVGYYQVHSFPLDLTSIDGYQDITDTIWNLWWSCMPTADGGTASWSRAMARRVMMSHFRSWCWYSDFLGARILRPAQVLSWYNAGKSVANFGVGDATANTGLGKLCFYESASEIATPGSDFVNESAMEHDLLYDGHPEWAGDTGWKATEEAYYAAKQGAAAWYAALMPSASFPD